jgi:predicted site-specific integrase-resolvase
MFNLDKVNLYYKDRSYDFHFKVLKDLCKIKVEIATIWANHRENMISQVNLCHYRIFSMSKEFASIIALFDRL